MGIDFDLRVEKEGEFERRRRMEGDALIVVDFPAVAPIHGCEVFGIF
jgi:hypothetical protein